MELGNFKLFSNYYDLLYKDKDYNKETDYIENLLKRYYGDVHQILELGTGTGIHADLLQKKGFRVTGIELSQEMAQQAREKGIECYINDCSTFNLRRKFDAVISLFHVISYITDNEKLIKTFNNVYNHLIPGGVFLFDVWYAPAVYNIKPETKIKRLENEYLKIIRIAEPKFDYNDNIVRVNYELIIEEKDTKNIQHLFEVHPMRFFTLPELNLIATITGFSIVGFEEWVTGILPSERTWGVCFILKRN